MAAAARRNAAAEISARRSPRRGARPAPTRARRVPRARRARRRAEASARCGRGSRRARPRWSFPRPGSPPGERALDLRARDARVHVRAVERPAAHDDGRQAVPRPRPHVGAQRPERRQNAIDRAPAERGVAGQHREEALRREKSRRQPERGPRVLRVEDRLALAQGAPWIVHSPRDARTRAPSARTSPAPRARPRPDSRRGSSSPPATGRRGGSRAA